MSPPHAIIFTGDLLAEDHIDFNAMVVQDSKDSLIKEYGYGDIKFIYAASGVKFTSFKRILVNKKFPFPETIAQDVSSKNKTEISRVSKSIQ